MSKEETVLFLFTQTCAILGKASGGSANSEMQSIKERVMKPYFRLDQDFDAVYSILEKKLAEKLSAEGESQAK